MAYTINRGFTTTYTSEYVRYACGSHHVSEFTHILKFTPNFEITTDTIYQLFKLHTSNLVAVQTQSQILTTVDSNVLRTYIEGVQLADITSVALQAAWNSDSSNLFSIRAKSGATSIDLNGTTLLNEDASVWGPINLDFSRIGQYFDGIIHTHRLFRTKLELAEVQAYA